MNKFRLEVTAFAVALLIGLVGVVATAALQCNKKCYPAEGKGETSLSPCVALTDAGKVEEEEVVDGECKDQNNEHCDADVPDRTVYPRKYECKKNESGTSVSWSQNGNGDGVSRKGCV